MSTNPTHPAARRRSLVVAAALLTSAASLAACADPVATGATHVDPKDLGDSKVLPVAFDTSASQKRPAGTLHPEIAAELPADLRASGQLVIGSGGAGGGIPPLNFTADDNRTPIGVEIDVAHLVADVLGLKADIRTTSWENLFIGIDSGKYEAAISNVGVSEERKDKYDFATYRLGLHAFEAKKGSGLTVRGPADVSGKRVAVGSGTLQEAILLRWNGENAKAGRAPAELVYYPGTTEYYLALDSGRIDLYLGPNPTATYHVVTAGKTQIVGTVSSSYPIPGKVGVLTKKGSGLAKPVSDAINAAIADGSYAKVLERWGLTAEAVPTSEVNPPGLPRPTSTTSTK
ncbi:ABC transporter substrate-binding protein [Intrasporangium sp. YIM S08009]|uniref:ABC transporter substrate-binding protein n=1 Tax=Intrasporangium zincisolvens TaxID=3080018 RepID=UPI002B05FBE7|nr:ABC transporter substrate-binding protein [Intrasporangium sp. YIM S08009]